MGIHGAKLMRLACAVLQQKVLVDGIVANVRRVWHVEVDKETAILKARWVEGNGVFEGNVNQTPFTTISCANLAGDEEEFVRTQYNQQR